MGIDDLSDVCNTFNYLLAVWNRLQRNMSTERFYARGVPLVSPAIVRMPRTALLMLYVSESRGRGEGWFGSFGGQVQKAPANKKRQVRVEAKFLTLVATIEHRLLLAMCG